MVRRGNDSDLADLSKEQLAVMNQVLVSVLNAKSFAELLDYSCTALARVARVYGCALYRMADNKLGLKLICGTGDYRDFLPDVIPQGSDLFRCVTEEGLTSSRRIEDKQLSLFQNHPVSIFCPIVVDENLVGAFVTIYDPSHSPFLDVVHRQMSNALEFLCKVKGISGELCIVEAPEGIVEPEEPQAADEAYGKLTPREREILTLLSEGLSNKEIAERLYVSSATIKNHVQSILSKLGVRSRAAAVAVGLRHKKRASLGRS